MGFLDHTTNNIIIDAVLTERGRELLARNDGSFRIDAFAFGDDEVDYSNIVKYGLNIGKEKIEKNTPIFEAQTNENLALKYNNITLSNSNIRILYIPQLQVYDTANVVLNLNNTSNSVVSQKVKILSTVPKESGQTIIDSNLADLNFWVKMNSELLTIYNSGVVDSNYIDEDENLVRTWQKSGILVESDTLNSPQNFRLSNRYLLDIDIGLIANLNNSTFEKFGTLTSTTVNNVTTVSGTINTYVEIVGYNSGARILIPITIQLN
jgi:hypothetical protein